MNLILFETSELGRPLPRGDRRATHILEILRRQPGDTFDAGLINGPRGKATLDAVTADSVVLSFAWNGSPSTPATITLIVGLPRPQTARDILRDATTLGVAAIHFVRTEKSDPSYAQSTLWTSGEWRRHVITGAEQAFDTRIPDITFSGTLADTLAALAPGSAGMALDNYESPGRLADFDLTRSNHHVLAVGGERGWSAPDRAVLRAYQFAFVHLGNRILRAETAVVSALSILRVKLGLM